MRNGGKSVIITGNKHEGKLIRIVKKKKKTVERLISTVVLLTITISALSTYPEKAQQESTQTPRSEAPLAVPETPPTSVLPMEDDVIPITQDGTIVEYMSEEASAESAAPNEEEFEAAPPPQKLWEVEGSRFFVDGLGNSVEDYRYGQPVPETEAVEDNYFSDAAFIGNSLAQGLMLFAELATPDYFAAQSINVGNISFQKAIQVDEENYITILSALSEKQYGKIYFMFGINEVDWEEDYFVDCYETLIDTIREQQPEAELYLQSITPIAVKLGVDQEKFTKERVNRFNELIQRVAEEKEAHYLYIYESMADENGDLPEGKSWDGIHPYRPLYRQWRDYLKIHTIREVKDRT